VLVECSTSSHSRPQWQHGTRHTSAGTPPDSPAHSMASHHSHKICPFQVVSYSTHTQSAQRARSCQGLVTPAQKCNHTNHLPGCNTYIHRSPNTVTTKSSFRHSISLVEGIWPNCNHPLEQSTQLNSMLYWQIINKTVTIVTNQLAPCSNNTINGYRLKRLQ